MKKLNKKDCFFLTILFSFILGFVFILRAKGFAFGSNIDWISQHITIPEYFRMLFYNNGNLLPQFSMNLGMGQNIFYFFYYGFFSPIILFSYLLPFLSMANYIQIISIINILISTYLLYKWINNKYNNNTAIIASIIFVLSGPLIYHSHRHIMFVNYFPFLMGALMSIDYYFLKKKSLPLIINSALMVLTSFYYSVPGFIVVGIYTLYKIIQNNKLSLKNFQPFLKIIFFIFIGVLLTSFIFIPSLYTIYIGRSNTSVLISLKDLIIPKLNYDLTFYYTYSLGLTFIYVISLIYNFLTKEKHKIFLSLVLSLCVLIPVFSYVLNVFMYIDGKCFIPFLPLALIVISNFVDDLLKNNVNIKKLLYILIPVILFMIYSASGYNKINLLITDIVITIFFLILISRFKKPKLIFFPIILIMFYMFYSLNINENYVDIKSLRNENNSKYLELLNEIDENSAYRTLINNNLLNKTNKVYSINQYNTSIYSSASNKRYLNFVRNVFLNEVINKDYATITGSNNVLFNIYTGTKYLISDIDPLIGYNFINEKDNTYIYENKDVLPIGYASSKIMSLREFNTLDYPYNVDALMNYVIVNTSLDNVYQSMVEKYQLEGKVINQKEIEYSLKNKVYSLKTKKDNNNINFKLDDPIIDKVLIIRFNMDFEKKGYNCSSEITINETTNSLSCSDWKYHNNNYSFEYVISSNKEITNLDISFSKGEFELSEIEFYTIDYSKIKNIKNNISEFFINKNLSKENSLHGEVNVKDDSYFKLTIPYEKKGFSVYIDGIKTKYELVDKAFIGFPISKGKHIIEIEFKAPYLLHGLALSIIGLIICIFIIIFDKLENQ
ncbi:MAG: YfhO family protein, partial [Bacilli bacterium]|nr:YfhO family protein [Bacilli bacterium]